MGTILASKIIGNAQTIIQDKTGVRWPGEEMLGWLNEGQREIVLLKPDTNVVNESVQLVAGTKQSIPDTGIVLIGLVRNMGNDGNTPGNAIRTIERTILDEQIPDWHSGQSDASAAYLIFDPRDPKSFYVYPPQPEQPGYVEIVYSSSPGAVAAETNTITLDDIYSGSLLDYILFRAYSKDAEYAGNGERAMSHYKKFVDTLSIKDQVEAANEVKTRAR